MRIGRAAGLTDTGRRRRQNEDAFVCDPPLFAIADGMGGAQAGELASRLAAAAIELSDAAGVGRGAENAIRLDGDTTVSGRHATLDSRADGLWVEDAGSTNGTFVNGAPVTTRRLLQPGDVIRIGHTDLLVEA